MHQTKINMLTFSAFFMKQHTEEWAGTGKRGVVSYLWRMTKLWPTAKWLEFLLWSLNEDVPYFLTEPQKQFEFFWLCFWSVCKSLLVADFLYSMKKNMTHTKHKRTSVESGGWSGAQQAFCGHSRPPASQITDRWGMQEEKAFTTCAGEKMCF